MIILILRGKRSDGGLRCCLWSYHIFRTAVFLEFQGIHHQLHPHPARYFARPRRPHSGQGKSVLYRKSRLSSFSLHPHRCPERKQNFSVWSCPQHRTMCGLVSCEIFLSVPSNKSYFREFPFKRIFTEPPIVSQIVYSHSIKLS